MGSIRGKAHNLPDNAHSNTDLSQPYRGIRDNSREPNHTPAMYVDDRDDWLKVIT